jgi:hypothetical protein
MKIDGQCFCGQITYEAEVDPGRVAICHCTDCQMHSATAYGVVVGIDIDAFRLLSGTLKTYVKVADSGNRRALTFCPECGTRIYGGPADGALGFVSLRVGTIRQRADLTPKLQVWARSRLPWVMDLSGIPSRDKQSLP